jgi:hypothetical protein
MLVQFSKAGKFVIWKGLNVQRGYPVCDEYELIFKEEVSSVGLPFLGIQKLYQAFPSKELETMVDEKWQGLHIGAISKFMNADRFMTLSSLITQKLLEEICFDC